MLSDTTDWQRDKVSPRLMRMMFSTLIFTVIIALVDVDTEVGVWAVDEGASKDTNDFSGSNHQG